MPVFSDGSSPNEIYAAADLHNLANGEQSWFDSLGDSVSNAKKFATAAAVSGVSGIYNTGVAIGNVFGADAEEINIAKTLQEMDSDLGRYYDENQTAIDLVGFIGTSFVPGTLGVKGYQMGSKALLAARSGRVGESMSQATGLLVPLREKYMAQAVREIGSSDAVFKFTNANYMKALAAEVGEQALQGAAFEAAVAATMFNSPVLKDMSVGEIAENALFGVGFSGVIGGALGGAGMWGKLKNAIRQEDAAIAPFRQIDEMPDFAPSDLKIRNYAQQRVMGAVPVEGADNFQLTKRLYDEKNMTLENKMVAEVRKISGDDVEIARRFVADIREVSSPQSLDAALAGLQRVRRVADDIDQGAQVKVGVPQVEGKNVVYVSNRDGDVTADFLPRLTDNLQKGERVVATDDYVRAGKQMYEMRADKAGLFDVAKVDRMAAEARYMWALDRPLMKGEFSAAEIAGKPIFPGVMENDVPMLERALRHWDTISKESGTLDVQLADRSTRKIHSADDLKGFIETKKLSLIDQMQAEGIDPREIAQRLNVSKPMAIDPGSIFLAQKDVDSHLFDLQTAYRQMDSGVMLSPFESPVHYKLEYASESVGDFTKERLQADVHFAGIERTMQEQADAFIKEFYPDLAAQLPDFSMQDIQRANRMGSKSSMMFSANGEYFTLESLTERIGQVTANQQIKESAAALKAVEPQMLAIKQDPHALQEFNLLDTTVRRTTTKYKVVDVDSNIPGQPAMSFLVPESLEAAMKDMALVGDGSGLESFFNYLRVQHGMHTNAKGGMFNPPLSKDFDLAQFGLPRRLENISDDTPVFLPMTPKVSDFVKSHIKQNDSFLTRMYELANQKGVGMRDFRGTFYAAPMDLDRMSHFAFVRDNSMGGSKHMGVLLARNAKELDEQIARVANSGPTIQVIRKDQLKEYKMAMGEYKYDLSIHENQVNSMLKRRGVLYNYAPPTDSPKILEDYLTFHSEKASQLVRESVANNYQAQFKTLEQLGRQHIGSETSIFGSVTNRLMNEVDNPYRSYVKTALNISQKSNFPTMHLSNWIEERADDVWNAMRSTWAQVKSMKDSDKLDEMNRIAMQRGLGTPYTDAAMEVLGNFRPDKNVLRKAVGKINAVLSGTMLGMDFMNAAVNTIGSSVLLSSEIKYIQKLVKDLPEAQAVNNLLKTKAPGTEIWMTSPAKIMARSIERFWKDDGALLARYKDLGYVLDDVAQLRQMVFEAGVTGSESLATLNSKAEAMFEMGRKLTGNKKAEEFNRFMAADIMNQLTEPAIKAGVMTKQQAETLMGTFVNRVNGNYLSSQRAMITQGAVGQAISLFLTYQMNMMQQLFKYVAGGDKRAAVTAMLVQGSVFGLQGLPGFGLINSHIANMAGNTEHTDLYDIAQGTLHNEAFEWAMYGLGSNIMGLVNPDLKMNLYSRGDLTPRNPLLFPTNPMDIPSVSLTSRFVSNLKQVADNISAGGDVWDSLLMGLEHNAVNRPLAGLASIMSGKSTTNQGTMISSVDLLSISNFSRVLGGKPFDEAMALDWYYRQAKYQANDLAKMKELSQAMRTTMEAGDAPTDEQMETFMSKYVKAGGNLENFNKFMVNAMESANSSMFADIKQKMQSPFSRYLQEEMGTALYYQDRGINPLDQESPAEQ